MDKLTLRLKSKIRIDYATNCWEWTSACAHGYGRYHFKGKTVFAHRLVYKVIKGELPNELDHLCRNTKCCNPDHLEGVTHRENMRRSPVRQVIREHWLGHLYCPRKHPLFGENLYVYVDRLGYTNKQCRTCRRESKRRRRANGAKD